MDTLLENGDMKRGAHGMPELAGGARELVQRAMIRLSVRRGSFAPDSTLGSELYTLGALPARGLDAAALNLVRQALLPLAGVTVTGASCLRLGDSLRLRVALLAAGEAKTLEMEVG